MKTILKPATIWGSWSEKQVLVVAQKRTTAKMTGNYDPSTGMSAPAVRLGADDHMQHPSRSGNTLTYRDGRIERVNK